MIEAAQKYQRIIQCGTQNRSADYSFTARDYIQSGKLGKIVLVKAFVCYPEAIPGF
jgi:predicted dehydrogenase